jgi:hypothetical protein
MVKSEYVVMDKTELMERIRDAQNTLDMLYDDLNDADSIIDYVPENNFEAWKENVINSLPEGASLKMRTDVEAWLETIKGVY